MATERLEIVIAAKDEFTRVFGGVQAAIAPVAKGLLAAGAAAGVAGAGLLALARSVAVEQDQFSKLSDKLGFSVENLSKLKYAADLADVGLENMAQGLQFMLRFTAEAAAGNETNRQSLASLGLELERLRTLAPDQMFELFAGAIAQVQNPAERAALAMEVFGRGGAEMLKMLKDGTAGLAELSAEAARFGVVVSTQAAYNAAEFNDSLTRLGAAFRGVRNALVEQFLPVMTGLFRNLAEYIADNRQRIVEWAQTFTRSIGAAFQALLVFGARVKDTFNAIGALIDRAKFTDNATQLKSLVEQAERYQKAVDGLNGRLAEMERRHSQAALEGAPAYDSLKNQVAQFNLLLESTKAQIAAINTANQQLAEDFTGQDAWSSERVRAFFEEITAGLEKVGTAKLPDLSGNFGALEIQPPKGLGATDGKAVDDLTGELAQLKSLWNEYYLSESERVDVWYAEQQDLFAGHLQALEMLEQVYAAKKTDLRLRDLEEESRKLQQIDMLYQNRVMTERDRLDAWYAEQLEKFSAYEETRAQIEEIYRKLSTDLDAEEWERRMQVYSNFLGGMAALSRSMGKRAFALAKALNIGQAIMNTYTGATNALKDYPYPYNIVAAAAVIAYGMAQVAQIAKQKPPEAHTGLDFVPREQTYLLSKGERVVQPQANRDLTEFLQSENRGGGTVVIEKLEVFPNVTDARALRNMDEREMQEIVEERIVPALRRLKYRGITA